MRIETARLTLREMGESDLPALRAILQNPVAMTAYGGAFSDEEVQSWLARTTERYATHGFGLWAVDLRETGEMIGQCGITLQPTPGGLAHEIGYLFQPAHWHRGYATEAATACKEIAFTLLGLESICSIIRDTNLPSQRVAQRVGMTPRETFVKHYRGVDIPHILYRVEADAEG